jgi:outer membrane receptor protein involved in Fe transport
MNFSKQSPIVQRRCVAAGVPSGGYKQTLGQVQTLGGGNPNLQPETSISRTACFIYSPSWLPGFNLNADYYKIEVDNAIISLSAQSVINACYLGGAQNFCQGITRNSQGLVSQLLNLPRNIASFTTNGFDIGIRYQFPSTPIGDFTLRAHESHIILFNETTPNFNGNGGFSTQTFVGQEPSDVGSGGEGFPDGVPANKANLDLNWDYGNWSAHYHVNFIESTTAPCTGSTPTHTYTGVGLCTIPAKNPLEAKYRRPDQIYQDAQVSYHYTPINTTFTAGVNNLFDRKPPKLYSDPTLDRVPGRFLYGRVTVTF